FTVTQPVVCSPGFADCDLNPANGCETDLSAIPNCGGCGITCDDGSGCTHDICVASACQHVDVTRCAIQPQTDPNECGAGGCDVCSFAAGVPGCPSPDTDGDGLTDAWEDAGMIDFDCNGVYDSNDVALPGANKYVQDIYLKVSWMDNSPTETVPDL